MAPEMFSSSKGHGTGVDWWSLGITLFELLVGQPPFFHDDPLKVVRQVTASASNINYPLLIHANAKSLLKKLLKKDPKSRLGRHGALDVKNHKWFTGLDWEALLERELVPPRIFALALDSPEVFAGELEDPQPHQVQAQGHDPFLEDIPWDVSEM